MTSTRFEFFRTSTILLLASWPLACGGGDAPDSTADLPDSTTGPPEAGAGATESEEHGHAHEEVSIGQVRLGPHEVQLWQGHGPLIAGEEAGLVVKLPYTDDGETQVRGWIGGEDRTRSFVGKGEYAPSHDDYDVHVTAPDPLDREAKWWVEIELPDGGTFSASATPLFE